jgi:hypothetical protein
MAWSFSVPQKFDWPGRIPLRKTIANRQMQLAELGFAQFKVALTTRTRTLAYILFVAQEKAAAAKEVADRFRQMREVLVQRDPAGLTPQLETRIIEATELSLQRKATEAALASQSALLELNQLRGAPWTNDLTIQPVKVAFNAGRILVRSDRRLRGCGHDFVLRPFPERRTALRSADGARGRGGDHGNCGHSLLQRTCHHHSIAWNNNGTRRFVSSALAHGKVILSSKSADSDSAGRVADGLLGMAQPMFTKYIVVADSEVGDTGAPSMRPIWD